MITRSASLSSRKLGHLWFRTTPKSVFSLTLDSIHRYLVMHIHTGVIQLVCCSVQCWYLNQCGHIVWMASGITSMVWIKIRNFSFKKVKIHFNMLSAKYQSVCPGGNEYSETFSKITTKEKNCGPLFCEMQILSPTLPHLKITFYLR